MFDTSRLDPRRFERAMHMLLQRIHGPNLRSIDGSGGDGGRDAILTTSDGVTVFEVKSYNERLTGSQQRAIKKSLAAGCSSEPDLVRWVLVIPLNRSPAEDAWFARLQSDNPDIELEWWGLDWLDGQLARNNDLERYIEGAEAQLLQRASEFKMEDVVFGRGARDVAERVATVKKRIDEISPFWTVDIQTRDNAQVHILRAKHPDATELDPITLRPTFTFDDESQHLRRRLVDVLDYGGDVEIPGQYVTDFDVEASEEAKRLLYEPEDTTRPYVAIESISEQIHPAVVGAIRIVDGEEPVAAIPMRFTHRTRGRRGLRLFAADIGDYLGLCVTMTGVPGETGKLTFTLPDPAGRTASSLLPSLEPLGSITADVRVDVEIGGTVAMRGDVSSHDGLREHARGLLQLVRSLRRLELHTRATLYVPPEVSDRDVEMLNGMAAALDATEPVPTAFDTYRVEIRPGRVAEFLESKDSTDGASLLAVIPDAQLGIGDAVDYGPLAMWAPTMRLLNRDELEAVGPEDSATAVFRCNDEPIRWLPRAQAEALATSTTTPDPNDGSWS